IWVGKAPHFDRGTGRKGPKVLHTHVNMLEELINVRHIRGRLHQIVESRPSRGECGLEIFAHLAELGAHVALPNDIALLVTRQLTGDKDGPSSFHGYHMGIQHMTVHDAREQCCSLDMMAWHTC